MIELRAAIGMCEPILGGRPRGFVGELGERSGEEAGEGSLKGDFCFDFDGFVGEMVEVASSG